MSAGLEHSPGTGAPGLFLLVTLQSFILPLRAVWQAHQ